MDGSPSTRRYAPKCFGNGLLTAIGLALFTLTGGCTEEPKGGPRVEVVPITGKVLIDGKPAADVVVDFRRPAGRGVEFPVPEPVGYTNKDGVIEASTYVTNDGVAPGEYKLLFSKGERVNPFTGESSGDVFKGKYNNYNKPQFTVTIPEELGDEPFDVGTYKLTTD